MASNAVKPIAFSASPTVSTAAITREDTTADMLSASASLPLYAKELPEPSPAVCTEPQPLTPALEESDYAFDRHQFNSAALKAAFSHDNVVKMAHNFVPGQALPDAPSYVGLTKKQKFEAFLRNSHSVNLGIGILSDGLIAQSTGAYPRLDDGGGGFGERMAISAAGAEVAAFFGGFVYPTLFHQDPRYFPSHQRNVSNRIAYAVSRVLIGRSDNGMTVINSSALASQFTEAAIANVYVPYRNRSAAGTIENALTGLAGVAEGNILNEFWPDITEFVWRHTHSTLIRKGMELGGPAHPRPYQ
jgi:hypothetical protein